MSRIIPADDSEAFDLLVIRGPNGAIDSNSPLSGLISQLSSYPDEKMTIQLINEGINIILSILSGSHPPADSFNSNDIQNFYQQIFQLLTTLPDKFVENLGKILVTKLFCVNLGAFEIFLSFFFTSTNVSNNNIGLKLFAIIITSPALHLKLCFGPKSPLLSLTVMTETIVNYYESKNHIWDKGLSTNLSHFIRKVYLSTSLHELFSKIQFVLANPDFHLAPLYYEFMVNGTIPERMNFIHVLIDTRSLHHFDSSIVTKDIPITNILMIGSQISVRTAKSWWGSCVLHPAFYKNNLSCSFFPFEIHSLNNTVFLEHTRHFTNQVRASVQSLFVRILYFASYKESISEQFNTPIDLTPQSQVSRLVILLNTFEGLSLGGMNSFVLKRIHDTIPSQNRCHFQEVMYRLRDILQNTASINVTRVNELLAIKRRVGKIKNGHVAVMDLFKNIFADSDMSNWSHSSLNDRLFYTYCFVKYPLEDFKQWAGELNNGKDFSSNLITPQFYDRFNEQMASKHLHGLKELWKYGYKFIQNSQYFAIFSALDATNRGLHYFGKLGTGQGKSLVFALLAIQYFKQGKKVVCFSCYDHLAKRDHQTFSKLFTDHGIKSKHLVYGTKEELEADVLYADLDTFASKCYSNLEGISKAEKDYIFDINSFHVALLDEFDALLIDSSSIGNTVYDQFNFLNLTGASSAEKAKLIFHQTLTQNPAYQLMFERLAGDGNESLFTTWSSKWGTNPPTTGFNRFGIHQSYVGGRWHQLSQGKFYLHLCRLDVFSYLLNMKTIVGLSGSISRETISQFREVLKKPDETDGFAYLEIPNFYGLKSGKNITKNEKYDCGSNWMDSVQADLNTALQKHPPVPILIFGDVNNASDWKTLQDLLRNACQRYHRNEQIIDKESQVEQITMSKATDPQYITLATHIVGRGADFKVNPEISKAGGLHVLITAVPNGDYRLLVQMIGRTARMDCDGTHSIILRGSKPKQDIAPLKIDQFKKDLSIVNQLVNLQIMSLPYTKSHWEKCFLLFNAVEDAGQWPNGFQGLPNSQKAERMLFYICDKGPGYFRSAIEPEVDLPVEKNCCNIM